MKFQIILSIICFSLFLCKTKDELMLDFANCARHQIGKPYVTTDSRGPDKFSNSGLVWYCRAAVGLSTTSTIYVSWKRVKEPKIGCHVYGITKELGSSVSTVSLGVIIGVNPPIIVQGDEKKGILVRNQFVEDPSYIRTEYHYVDF